MRRWILVSSLCLALLAGCSAGAVHDETGHSLGRLQDLYTYELNAAEPEHAEQVEEWLREAKADSEDRQMFLLTIGDDRSDMAYAYIYGKGYRDYEVTFVYSVDEPETGKLHVAGLNQGPEEDAFVKVKFRDSLVDSFILSDDAVMKKSESF